LFRKEANHNIWAGNSRLGLLQQEQVSFLRYPLGWPNDDDIWTMQDFIEDVKCDSVEVLCRGYEAFDFGRLYGKGLLFPAFREVQGWPQSGVLWGNLTRCAYIDPDSTRKYSILRAPSELRDVLVQQQKALLLAEISILDPHICIFFTGPNYDSILSGTFENCKFIACDGYKERQLARLAHPVLPAMSYRTYHPSSLNRQGLWGYIDAIRDLAYGDE
jgi:hypothetical protein